MDAEPAITIPSVPLKKLPEAQITSERPGDIRYQNRRLLVLYFDMTAMPPPDQLRAIAAAERFVRTQMTPARPHGAYAIRRERRGSCDV